jgi:hypothetical protein
MIRTFNDAILEQYGTYVVATPRNRPEMNDAPFGIPLDWHFDPLAVASAPFLDLLQRLDSLTFGPEGMPMDKWVFYDCAELPGFIYGFATPAAELTDHERELFGVRAGYEGPVPISMYIAIPMYEEGTWFGHNLASLNRTFPERGLHHLGSITKAIALKAFRVERFVGATQWESKALYIHTKFGPLDLQTTYTPAHSIAETLTYAHEVTDERLRAAAGDQSVVLERPEPDFFIDAHDIDHMKRLQAEIESGARFVLVGPPAIEGSNVVHPICRLDGRSAGVSAKDAIR